MIGSFMINPESEVCFAQFSDSRKIEKIKIFENRTVLFCYTDGTDDFMIAELNNEIFQKIEDRESILVAKVNKDGTIDDETYADLDFEY